MESPKPEVAQPSSAASLPQETAKGPARSPGPESGTAAQPPGDKPPTVASLAKGRKPDAGKKFVVMKQGEKYILAQRKLTPEELAAPKASKKKTPTADAGGLSSTTKKAGAKSDATAEKHAPPNADSPKTTQPSDEIKPTLETKDGLVSKQESGSAAERDLGAEEAALRDQDLQFKKGRRHKFKTALLSGFARGIVSNTLDLGDLGEHHDHGQDGDDGWDDHSEPDDSDLDYDDHDGHHDDSPDASIQLHDGHGVLSTGLQEKIESTSVNVASAVATAAVTQPSRQLPPHDSAGEKEKTSEREKGQGYVFTVKDQKDFERKVEKAATEQRLKRHWENASFYFMASLSIILPALFVALGILILKMDGKAVDSTWGNMVDSIKVAITAWPIVFAAVVAQALKTYATFRVERGIKLWELEQLVGSNSFSSAAKQPLSLRRVNILMLFLLAVWCLSPIGSQALQRVYSQHRVGSVFNDTAYYVAQLGPNRMLSQGVNDMTIEDRAAAWQAMSIYYQASFLQVGVATDAASQDQYGHPLLRDASKSDQGLGMYLGGAYGIPIIMPDVVTQGKVFSPSSGLEAIAPYEIAQFYTDTSYYAFTCNDAWQLRQYRDISNLENPLVFSASGTLGVRFSSSDSSASSINHVAFAANVNQTTQNAYNGTVSDDAYFMFIECDFQQKFVNQEIICHVSMVDDYDAIWQCRGGDFTPYSDSAVPNNWATDLDDFSNEFVGMGNPAVYMTPMTPTEIEVENPLKVISGFPYTSTEAYIRETVPPPKFAQNFGYLFNTWTTLGSCPQCVGLTKFTVASQTPVWAKYYKQTHAIHDVGNVMTFQVVWPWAWTFLASAIVLLLAGVIGAAIESLLVAPDTLGYVCTVVRNSRYLKLPKTTTGVTSGAERARRLGHIEVMMQDIKPDEQVGKIALGMKKENSKRLTSTKMYR